MKRVIGDARLLRSARARRSITDEKFGLPTVHRHPARSWKSRAATRVPSSRPPSSRKASRNSKDLKPGMVLEGVVTNVTDFGAFVDIGVHQDGLVHISALADKFVKDPREVVKAGDVVKVKVLEVDLKRKRIALTMRLGDEPGSRAAAPGKPRRPTAVEASERQRAVVDKAWRRRGPRQCPGRCLEQGGSRRSEIDKHVE